MQLLCGHWARVALQASIRDVDNCSAQAAVLLPHWSDPPPPGAGPHVRALAVNPDPTADDAKKYKRRLCTFWEEVSRATISGSVHIQALGYERTQSSEAWSISLGLHGCADSDRWPTTLCDILSSCLSSAATTSAVVNPGSVCLWQGSCDQGSVCSFAHGEAELRRKGDPVPSIEFLRSLYTGANAPDNEWCAPRGLEGCQVCGGLHY